MLLQPKSAKNLHDFAYLASLHITFSRVKGMLWEGRGTRSCIRVHGSGALAFFGLP